jgi:hypothetical protein
VEKAQKGSNKANFRREILEEYPGKPFIFTFHVSLRR